MVPTPCPTGADSLTELADREIPIAFMEENKMEGATDVDSTVPA